MTKRTIPEIRTELHNIAAEIRFHGLDSIADQIHDLAQETIRESPTRRKAPVKHPPLTDAEKQDIVDYAFANPDIHLQEVATKFNTNTGRVSEALAEGKRE